MSKIAAILALFMVVGLFAWLIVLPFVSLTGYPPSDRMQVWYLPSPDYVSGDNASAMEAIVDEMVANGTYNETTLAEYVSSMDAVVNETFAEYFSLTGERKEGASPPSFHRFRSTVGMQTTHELDRTTGIWQVNGTLMIAKSSHGQRRNCTSTWKSTDEFQLWS